jgi:hypothetical protein
LIVSAYACAICSLVMVIILSMEVVAYMLDTRVPTGPAVLAFAAAIQAARLE